VLGCYLLKQEVPTLLIDFLSGEKFLFLSLFVSLPVVLSLPENG
jgi:hypothetical protein